MKKSNLQVAHRNYMSREDARELWDYDRNLGVLKWKQGKNAGRIAGAIDNNGMGRTRVRIWHKGKSYAASYLIWIIHHGYQVPDHLVIDHNSRNACDNRIDNLKLVTTRANCKNRGPRLSIEQILCELPYKYQFEDSTRPIPASYNQRCWN